MSTRKPAAPKQRPTARAETAAPAQPLSAAEQEFIESMQRHCQQRGAQLTPLRIEVLLQMQKHAGSVKAYELLAELQARKPGFTPMSLYRTLDFLVEQELVHKVDATSSFILCEHGHHSQHDHGHPMMLICERCGQVAECSDPKTISALQSLLSTLDDKVGFHAHNVEIKGICAPCAAAEKQAEPAPEAR